MAGYDKSKAAEMLGVDKKGLERLAEAAGFKHTEDYYKSIGGAAYPIIQAIKKELVELDRQLSELKPVGITDEEIEQFLTKAIEEVQPYYDRKSAELEAQLQEGKVRTAEDILTSTREVEEEIAGQLAYYDLRTAETEEDFIDRIADITSTTAEALSLKKDDWRQRLEDLKVSQIQGRTLTSGIGGIEREKEEVRANLELSAIQRRSETERSQVEAQRKYDIENIKLARQSAEQERIRKIGPPAQAEETKSKALETLGLGSLSELGSKTELERARTARGIRPEYNRGALQDLEEQRRIAVEARKQEIQASELAPQEQEYARKRQSILAEAARKRSQLSTYGVY